MVGWDRGLDYDHVYSKLLRTLQKCKTDTCKCYTIILLVQLRNGLRISEAIRAVKDFLLNKKLETEVKVSKKRKHEARLAVLPREISVDDLKVCYDVVDKDERVLVLRITNWCKQRFNFNTHSLRYAFITHLLRSGVSPSIIAKITRHSRLDYILTYTQEKAAEEILRKM